MRRGSYLGCSRITLAFKDLALQLVGRMFDFMLSARRDRVTIVGATSGDTGSAAIEACRDRDNIDIYILFPVGRVSPVQQRQMTTVESSNVHALAVDGTFDDCQDLVKGMFNDAQFRDAHNLSAVKSINWARVRVQIVYYFAAAVCLGAPGRQVSFAVPTGNFGNVLAGWSACKCGLPVEKLVVGTNSNDILFRFFETGEMKIEAVNPSLSPSMDIQVSSNFERLLFDMLGGDGAAVRVWIDNFRSTGAVRVDDTRLAAAKVMFAAARLDDDGTRRVIGDLYKTTGELVDPHSAIGVDAGRRCRGDSTVPMISLATAHPAKFPDAVEQATGIRPDLPARISDLFDRDEKFDMIENDLDAVQDFIRRTASTKS